MPTKKQDLVEADLQQFGIYQVFTGSGTGTGFLLDERHLLTNCHVVAPFRTVAIERRDRTRVTGRLRRVHPHRDLAIVELSEPLAGAVLPIVAEQALKSKQRVSILGFPIGLPLSVTEGIVSNPRQLFDEQYFLQTDAAINPGNSGGPMLNEQMQVVAVTTCKIDSAEAVGFGIPSPDVARFVADFRAQTSAFGVQCPACEELLCEAVRDCPNCGTDLDNVEDFRALFEAPDLDPLADFVETALTQAGIDPVLARDGGRNWSFRTGSHSIKVWCCCSDHVNFTSSLAEVGGNQFDALFRYLLAADHAPYSFDLYGRSVRLIHVLHMADVFSPEMYPALCHRVANYIAKVQEVAPVLLELGCKPAPEHDT